MLLAASTQRTIGLVILAIVVIGAIAYIYFNIRAAKAEIGSEIELAPNRSEPLTDENLEGKRLDLNLGAALAMLTLIGVALPVYWLGEPGRQEGWEANTDRIFGDRGGELYSEGAGCVDCHGAAGVGGVSPVALTDEAGDFVAQVNWKAPALNTLLSRYSEDEVLHVLNFGRNGVMPAWGAPGGGPLTEQQLEELIFYIRRIQIDETTIRASVEGGIRRDMADDIVANSDEAWAVAIRDAEEAAARAEAEATRVSDEAEDPDDPAVDAAEEAQAEAADALAEARAAAEESLTAEVDAVLAAADAAVAAAEELALEADEDLAGEVERASTEDEVAAADDALRRAALELLSQPGAVPGQEAYWDYGGFLFANSADNGTYNCARCHTAGWSYDGASDYTLDINGREGPLPQFEDGYTQGCGFYGANLCGGTTLNQFETASSHSDFVADGQSIGEPYGAGGSGDTGQMPGFGPLTDDDLEVTYPGILTQAQIDAIVAYERNL